MHNPFANNLLPDRTFNKVVYKDQVQIGGTAIQQGKVVGTSATVEEKGVTVNVSSNVINRWLVVQGTLKGTSEEGFVDVFSSHEYQRTLGAGGTILLFTPYIRAGYAERTKKNLQETISRLRKQETKTWVDPYIPIDYGKWTKKYSTAADDFIRAWINLQGWLAKQPDRADRFYTGELIKREPLDTIGGLRIYRQYVAAEHALAPLLTGWDDYNDQETETSWITDTLTRRGFPSPFAALLLRSWQDSCEQVRQARLLRYDSLMMAAPFGYRRLLWGSLTGLYNSVKQPILDSTANQTAYASSVHDPYYTFQAALNFIHIGTRTFYASLGLGINNMRVFKKEDLVTYQTTSWQHTGSDSVQVIKQNQLYPKLPDKIVYRTWQTQVVVAWPQLAGLGLEVTGRGQYGAHQPDRYAATLGIFFPLKAADTTLLFMPQAKWASESAPTRWTFGFNLTASIPGFVKAPK